MLRRINLGEIVYRLYITMVSENQHVELLVGNIWLNYYLCNKVSQVSLLRLSVYLPPFLACARIQTEVIFLRSEFSQVSSVTLCLSSLIILILHSILCLKYMARHGLVPCLSVLVTLTNQSS